MLGSKKISFISIRFRRCLKYWKLSQCSITAEHFPCPQMSSQTSLSPFLNVRDGMLSSYVTVCPRILQSAHLLRFSVAPMYMMFQLYSAFVITWYADFVNRINIIWCWTLIKVVLRGFSIRLSIITMLVGSRRSIRLSICFETRCRRFTVTPLRRSLICTMSLVHNEVEHNEGPVDVKTGAIPLSHGTRV